MTTSDERALLVEIAKWRSAGDSWRAIAAILQHTTDLLPPSGAPRWTAKLAREAFGPASLCAEIEP
jgi:hypothetical protein